MIPPPRRAPAPDRSVSRATPHQYRDQGGGRRRHADNEPLRVAVRGRLPPRHAVRAAAAPVVAATRGALEAIGGGIWDVGVGAARVFSSAASVRSASGSADNGTAAAAVSPSLLQSARSSPWQRRRGRRRTTTRLRRHGAQALHPEPVRLRAHGQADLSDHLAWLIDRRRYKEAWDLVCEHPEAVPVSARRRLYP